MQVFGLVALLFVAGVSAEEVSNVQPVSSNVVAGQPQSQLVPVHSVVEQPQVHAVHQAGVEHHHSNDGHQHHYAPVGVIQPVAASGQQHQHQFASAPVGEQYGKPESASIPANYKPFGSWGLYIGGNPADGYYSSYYKALGNTVDKQQVSGVEQASGLKPAPVSGAVQGQTSSPFNGPILKQAVSYPYNNYDQVYPFDYYTTSDLNSGSRVAVVDQSAGGPSVYSSGAIASPIQVGSQMYGVPVSSYNSEQPAFAYANAEQYATKRLGSKSPERAQPAFQQQQQQQQQQVKGYYAAHAPSHYAAPMGQPQVVAYPVPVGSQIVGSQPGTEGAYTPYGVHGYTRYAVKPTVVSSSDSYYAQGVHSSPVSHFPVYKQQQVGAVYQPLSFYGYPLSQLHYSQGSIVPSFGQQGPSMQYHHQHQAGVVPSGAQSIVGVHHEQVAGTQPVAGPEKVEAASSDKSETQSANNDQHKQQQKRA